ncbi:MAG: hypothetical protein L6R28_08190 [Planctomycetes bacterium]|nr:hypothetical protein [Planctomycetota bacterium]
MNAATHAAPASEPSPLQAAQEAALRARRAAAAFLGLLLLVDGLIVASFGVLGLVGAHNRFLAQDLLPIPLLLGAAGTVLVALAYVNRKRAGLTAIFRTPLPESGRVRGLLAVAALYLAVGVGVALATIDRTDATAGERATQLAVVAIFYAAGLALLLWGFARTRLWEILLVAAVYLLIPPALALTLTSKNPDDMPFWLGLGALAGGALGALAGTSLELRWRAFVRSVPKEDAA